MKRAIIVFLENKKHLLQEFAVLYTSFKKINSPDTDLIVVGHVDALRRLPKECIRIAATPINNKPEWHNYHYINSIICLGEKRMDMLQNYDLVLRCDVDTFVTPAWNTFYPEKYMTGKGAYVNDEYTKEKIIQTAQHLGLKHKGIFNIGSTHYGNAKLVRSVCILAGDISKYLLNTEFINTEGKWPGWFRGVTSMYAMEIATNHLVDEFIINGELLDAQSTSAESIDLHPHIHCWHTNELFSKFKFEQGAYDKRSLFELDTQKVHDYCLSIALQSKIYNF